MSLRHWDPREWCPHGDLPRPPGWGRWGRPWCKGYWVYIFNPYNTKGGTDNPHVTHPIQGGDDKVGGHLADTVPADKMKGSKNFPHCRPRLSHQRRGLHLLASKCSIRDVFWLGPPEQQSCWDPISNTQLKSRCSLLKKQ